MPESTSKQARVCLLIDSFYPVVGGGESHARILSKYLTKLGTPVLVVTQYRLREHVKNENLDGYPVYRVGFPEYSRFGKYLMIPACIMKLFGLRNNFDCIYVCGLRTLGLPAVVFGKLFKKIVVLRAESCGEMLAPDFQSKSRFITALLRMFVDIRNSVLKNADSYLAISSVIEEEYIQTNISKGKIIKIPNGIDLNEFFAVQEQSKNLIRMTHNLPDNKFLFVYTGKLNRGKGLELLLRSFYQLNKAHPDTHLVLVGAGTNQYLSCETELRKYVEDRRLQDKVTFTGNVADVAKYLQACDAFVIASESEALCISLIEAMACGLSSIATRAGGIPDVINNPDLGFLFEINNQHELVSHMEYLLDRRNKQKILQMRNLAVQSIRDRFAISVIAERHQQLFNSLVN